MGELAGALNPETLQAILGYLNFSDGRPDARWQNQVNDAFRTIQKEASPQPWNALLQNLNSCLEILHQSDRPAFREITQAREVLRIAKDVLISYRQHHRDLLCHLTDTELFGPFFLARIVEATLQLRQGEDSFPDAKDVVRKLNDFLGHRPIAVLESRPQGEPYDHERHRPLPVFLRGAGVAVCPYEKVIIRCLDILQSTDPSLLQDASFSLDQLEEVAIDLRAYDHGHPVNRRPNYVFGEWDPHHIDSKGRYSRYVIRKVTLDALMDRVENARELDSEERLFEGAAVLAGTILMATGVSGWGPGAHDSTNNLATLLPRIARYRDLFYENLSRTVVGAHGRRLHQEQEKTRQPFGAARQHLNNYLAKHRAGQMQHRHLSLLFAEMGYPQASAAEAGRILSVSARMLGQILSNLTAGQIDCDNGRLDAACGRLPEIESLLHRGIDCGAFADPWNILGFQGLFPLSSAREDALRDPRLDELLQVMEQTFNLKARLMSEAAAAGNASLVRLVGDGMKKLAAWWDRFATYEVSDLRRIHGGEATQSARNVARALAAWRKRGETVSDLAFWRDRLGDFRSPQSFALVVEALIHRGDHRAALGLLASWLSQAGMISLEDGKHSFHNLALRWMLTLTRGGLDGSKDLVRRLFDVLEANAEDYWEVPELISTLPEPTEDSDSEKEDPFEAAYEGVTFRDSADDQEDGAVADGTPRDHFELEADHERLDDRLRFLTTLARLWQLAARFLAGDENALSPWLKSARKNRQALQELLNSLNRHDIPEPTGDHDSLVEFDRRRVIKEQLIYTAIATCLDTSLAVGAIRGALGSETQTEPDAPPWEPDLLRLEKALFAGNAELAKAALPGFINHFRDEPLLFTPLAEGETGGDPRGILRARIAQAVLRALLANLPRLGLIRETFDLLRLAREMEKSQPTKGRGVTEFNHFFQAAYQAVVENVIRSSQDWPSDSAQDDQMVALLERLTAPFLALWIEHSRTLQLSVMEGISGEKEWKSLVAFIKNYGRELFHARFMTMGNLRAILHRGIDNFLVYLEENEDPLRPSKLVANLDQSLRRADTIKHLEVVLQAVVENYEEYKDYNTTTTQSDYGENLYILLDFLRLKTQYERNAWQFKPLVLAHEMLARHGKPSTAIRWQGSLVHFTRELSGQHLEHLSRLESLHGIRLGTVSDRLQERFVKSLALDRLASLVDPCLQESRRIDREEDRPTFGRFQEELRCYTKEPIGVGLDVPFWLLRLGGEVTRAKAVRSDLAQLVENFFKVQRVSLSFEDLQRQLREWERPALPR